MYVILVKRRILKFRFRNAQNTASFTYPDFRSGSLIKTHLFFTITFIYQANSPYFEVSFYKANLQLYKRDYF
ncbi:MAG: hypothetical protein V3U80_01205 [Flavobacteriaceae bacterium]